MSYEFNFDLSGLPKSFFSGISELAGLMDNKTLLNRKIAGFVRKYTGPGKTGLPRRSGARLVRDLVTLRSWSIKNRPGFLKAKKKALLLPHCSRQQIDSRCKSVFNPKYSSFHCSGCDADCLVNKATRIAAKKGYDVFILPGGSCMKRIVSKGRYDGILGVACCEEMKLAGQLFGKLKIPVVGLPLIRNGCSRTRFSLRELEELL